MNEPWKIEAWDRAAMFLRSAVDQRLDLGPLSMEERRELRFIQDKVAAALERKARTLKGSK